MSDVVIRAEGLGKAYQIRHAVERPYTRFSEMLTERAARLLRGARREADPTHETFWALREVQLATPDVVHRTCRSASRPACAPRNGR